MIVSEAVEEFTAAPFINVVAVSAYFPVQVLFGIVNGNDTLFEVFAGKVNGGVVNITDCAVPHLFGCKVPFSVNLTETV